MSTTPHQPEAASGIETVELGISYHGRTILRDVSLACPQQQITAIIGPSGCGKTSFLNALNRISDMVPGCRVMGEAWIGGENVLTPRADLIALRRRVGMLFQKPNPFPLSIRENIHLALRELGMSATDREVTLQQVLEEVGLWGDVRDRLRKPAQQLSGGQQQRLCLARALALRPTVLLCDEPCSALDPVATRTVEELLRSLKSRMTILIVTHNLAQARRLADQTAVFWVEDQVGRLLEVGRTTQLFDNPTSPLTAAYLQGRMG